MYSQALSFSENRVTGGSREGLGVVQSGNGNPGNGNTCLSVIEFCKYQCDLNSFWIKIVGVEINATDFTAKHELNQYFCSNFQ